MKEAPLTANPDTASAPQGVPVTVDVIANDTPSSSEVPIVPGKTSLIDPKSGKSTSTVTGDEGTWTVKPKDGGVEFTPAKPFTGQTPKLGYIITDDSGEKATSTVEVTVTPVTPTAVDDRSRTTPDTPVVIPVLDNDIPGNPKVPSNPTTVVIIDPATKQPEKAVIIPGEGSYIVDPSGDISFTPAPGFDGSGTPLRYQVLDANGTMAAATLTVGDILPITGFGMV